MITETQSTATAPASSSGKPSMTVAIRVRPLLPHEEHFQQPTNNNAALLASNSCVTVDVPRATVTVEERKLAVDLRPYVETRGVFKMDYAFDPSARNIHVYVQTVRPQLLDALHTPNGRLAIFAHGQTGSGKSWTMLGTPAEHGIFALAVRDLLQYSRGGLELRFSFYEIYGGKTFDLLNERNELRALEDDKQMIHLKGLSEFSIEDEDTFLELLHRGAACRSAGSTSANDRSSRSHAVALFHMCRKTQKGTLKIMSRFTFIDLAGSERGRDTLESQKATQQEGAEINKSLLAVKECVRALHGGQQHVPFRGSKLTQVLRESLSGRCSTVMIAMVSPFFKHVEDTTNVLKYTAMFHEVGNNSSSNVPSPSSPASVNINSNGSGGENGGKERRNSNSQNNNTNRGGAGTHSRSESLGSGSISPGAANNNNHAASRSPNQHPFLPHIECCNSCGYPLWDDGLPHSCPKASVRCPHCTVAVPKRGLELHIAEACPDAVVACSFCRAEMPRKLLEEHESNKCSRSFATCQQCQQRVTPRGALQHHVAELCPAAKWMCPFCKIVTARRNAEDHAATCAARLTTCDSCGFRVRIGHLKQHKRVCVGVRRVDELMEQEVVSPKGVLLAPLPQQQQQHQSQQAHQTQQQQAPPPPPPLRGISKPPVLAHLRVPTVPALTAMIEPSSSRQTQQLMQAPAPQQQTSSPPQQQQQPKPLANTSRPQQQQQQQPPSSTNTTRTPARQVKPIHSTSPSPQVQQQPVSSRNNKQPHHNQAAAATPPSLSPMHVAECHFCHGHFLESVLQQHIENDCMQVMVACPFADAGCKHLVTRQQLAIHLNENVGQHLVLLHSKTKNVEAENAALRMKLNEIVLQKREPETSAAAAASASTQAQQQAQQQQQQSQSQKAAIASRLKTTKQVVKSPSQPRAQQQTPNNTSNNNVPPLKRSLDREFIEEQKTYKNNQQQHHRRSPSVDLTAHSEFVAKSASPQVVASAAAAVGDNDDDDDQDARYLAEGYDSVENSQVVSSPPPPQRRSATPPMPLSELLGQHHGEEDPDDGAHYHQRPQQQQQQQQRQAVAAPISVQQHRHHQPPPQQQQQHPQRQHSAADDLSEALDEEIYSNNRHADVEEEEHFYQHQNQQNQQQQHRHQPRSSTSSTTNTAQQQYYSHHTHSIYGGAANNLQRRSSSTMMMAMASGGGRSQLVPLDQQQQQQQADLSSPPSAASGRSANNNSGIAPPPQLYHLQPRIINNNSNNGNGSPRQAAAAAAPIPSPPAAAAAVASSSSPAGRSANRGASTNSASARRSQNSNQNSTSGARASPRPLEHGRWRG